MQMKGWQLNSYQVPAAGLCWEYQGDGDCAGIHELLKLRDVLNDEHSVAQQLLRLVDARTCRAIIMHDNNIGRVNIALLHSTYP